MENKTSILKEILDFVKDIVISIVVMLIVVTFVIKPVQVIGRSMYPTLKDGAFGVSNIIGAKLGHIDRFDIVIIYLEEKDEYIVKRVVGLPNETVSDEGGQLYINGEAIEEPFFDETYVSTYDTGTFMSEVSSITLGDDEYYCLGDNRPHSSDSRVYGTFTKDQILAKGIFIIWPFTEIGVRTW